MHVGFVRAITPPRSAPMAVAFHRSQAASPVIKGAGHRVSLSIRRQQLRCEAALSVGHLTPEDPSTSSCAFPPTGLSFGVHLPAFGPGPRHHATPSSSSLQSSKGSSSSTSPMSGGGGDGGNAGSSGGGGGGGGGDGGGSNGDGSEDKEDTVLNLEQVGHHALFSSLGRPPSRCPSSSSSPLPPPPPLSLFPAADGFRRARLWSGCPVLSCPLLPRCEPACHSVSIIHVLVQHHTRRLQHHTRRVQHHTWCVQLHTCCVQHHTCACATSYPACTTSYALVRAAAGRRDPHVCCIISIIHSHVCNVIHAHPPARPRRCHASAASPSPLICSRSRGSTACVPRHSSASSRCRWVHHHSSVCVCATSYMPVGVWNIIQVCVCTTSYMTVCVCNILCVCMCVQHHICLCVCVTSFKCMCVQHHT